MEKLQIIKGNVEIRDNKPENTNPNAPEDAQTPPKDDKATTAKLGGYAIMFNEPSEVMTTEDGTKFTETVSADALQGVDLSHLVLLSDHDYKQILASVDAGTLTATIDEKGLAFEATLDSSVSYANDVYQNVKNGNIQKMSFGFQIADKGDSWTKEDDGSYSRTINKIAQLYELSVCVLPAYSDTEVSTRSLEKFINDNSKEKDNKTMEKTIIKPNKENTEVRSFEAYIKSAGETRDGLTTDVDGKAIIPSEIVSPIFESKKGSNRLSDYVTVKKVSVGQGTYPISTNDPSKTLMTKQENALIGNVDPEVTGVEFKTQTRAGRVYLSQELIDDNAINFSAEIQAQMQKLVDNTDNAQIIAKLKTLSPVVVKSVDAIKQAKNTKLDPSLQPVVVVNQSAFNWLDTQKDSEGRYLMSEDIQAPTGKALFGLPVVELSDVQLPNIDGTKFPMYIGDLSETIALFRRNQVTTSWKQFDSYSQGLAIVLRNDYQFIDKTATVALTIDTSK